MVSYLENSCFLSSQTSVQKPVLELQRIGKRLTAGGWPRDQGSEDVKDNLTLHPSQGKPFCRCRTQDR